MQVVPAHSGIRNLAEHIDRCDAHLDSHLQYMAVLRQEVSDMRQEARLTHHALRHELRNELAAACLGMQRHFSQSQEGAVLNVAKLETMTSDLRADKALALRMSKLEEGNSEAQQKLFELEGSISRISGMSASISRLERTFSDLERKVSQTHSVLPRPLAPLSTDKVHVEEISLEDEMRSFSKQNGSSITNLANSYATRLEPDSTPTLHSLQTMPKRRSSFMADLSGTLDTVVVDTTPQLVEDLLKDISIFKDFPSWERGAIASLCQRVQHSKGQNVIDQGAEGTAFYIVERGWLRVLKDGLEIRTIRQGAYFGKNALLNGIRHPATIQVGNEGATVWKLERTDLANLFPNSEDLIRKLGGLAVDSH